MNEQATWLTPEWIEYFGLALSVHHGMTTEPLAHTSFETVFGNACESVDWKIVGADSQTMRFLDLRVKGEGVAEQKLSLKSTAAQRLSRRHLNALREASKYTLTSCPKKWDHLTIASKESPKGYARYFVTETGSL